METVATDKPVHAHPFPLGVGKFKDLALGGMMVPAVAVPINSFYLNKTTAVAQAAMHSVLLTCWIGGNGRLAQASTSVAGSGLACDKTGGGTPPLGMQVSSAFISFRSLR